MTRSIGFKYLINHPGKMFIISIIYTNISKYQSIYYI